MFYIFKIVEEFKWDKSPITPFEIFIGIKSYKYGI